MNPPIRPGVYRLICDVKNPKPDRRMSHDWRAKPVWEAGMRLIVRPWIQVPEMAKESRLVVYSGPYSHQIFFLDDAPLDLLASLAPSKRLDDRVRAALDYDEQHWDRWVILRLVADGKVTLEDLGEASQKFQEMSEEQTHELEGRES